MNIYRGCGHGCRYCFAQYSHWYVDSDDFFGDIHVKVNIAERLDEELGKKGRRKERINIGGVTDSYQPLEREYRLMPEVLKVVGKHANPILIPTKSVLIMRDFELIKNLAKSTRVDIAVSVSTLDEEIRALIEPEASPSEERFKTLGRFKEAGCSATVLLMPVIPYLTARKKNLDAIFKMAGKYNVDKIVHGALNLRGQSKKKFLDFLRSSFPHIYPKYLQLYKNGGLPRSYRRSLNSFMEETRVKRGF